MSDESRDDEELRNPFDNPLATPRDEEAGDQAGQAQGWNPDDATLSEDDALLFVLTQFRELVAGGGATPDQALASIPEAQAYTLRDPEAAPGSNQATTVRQLLAEPNRWTREEIIALQRKLYEAGAFSPEVYAREQSINWGVFDPTTRAAWQRTLAQITFEGRFDVDKYLAERRSAFSRDGTMIDGTLLGGEIGEEVQQQVADIKVTDRTTIEDVALDVFRSQLGRNPNEAELNALVDRIHSKERASQRAFYDANAELIRQDAGELPSPVATYDARRGRAVLTAEQTANARTIIDVGKQMGMSDDAIVMALSVGMVESGLRNVPYGDRDSVGIFQQRSHYGSAAARLDVANSARMFFEEAMRYSGATLGEWAANTQRPAAIYRGRYAERMDDAAAVFSTLAAGRGPAEFPGGGFAFGPEADAGEQRKSLFGVTFDTGSFTQRAASENLPGMSRSGETMDSSSAMLDPYVFIESTSMPSARAEARALARERNPVEYEAHEFAERADEFVDLLLSSQDYF